MKCRKSFKSQRPFSYLIIYKLCSKRKRKIKNIYHFSHTESELKYKELRATNFY